MHRFSLLKKTNNSDFERGSASLLASMCIGLTAAICFAVGTLGVAVVNDARAHIAAEAAALSGAIHDRNHAIATARMNGASIVDYQLEGSKVSLVVEIKGARASAHADVVGFSTLKSWPLQIDSSP